MTIGNDNIDVSNCVSSCSEHKMVPPILGKGYRYSNSKYDLCIWQAFTSLREEKNKVLLSFCL